MTLAERLLEHPTAYRLWQAPFAEDKLRPLLRHPDVRAARRVLDVACGPGTNARHFAGAEYVGLDLNPRYIAWARAHEPGRFEVADLTAPLPPLGGPFDCILVNSFLHHLDDGAATAVLGRLRAALAPGGFIHLVDLLLPERASVARLLARLDRGHWARPLAAWERMFGACFEAVAREQFALTLAGVPLWHMVHLKGRSAA